MGLYAVKSEDKEIEEKGCKVKKKEVWYETAGLRSRQIAGARMCRTRIGAWRKEQSMWKSAVAAQ